VTCRRARHRGGTVKRSGWLAVAVALSLLFAACSSSSSKGGNNLSSSSGGAGAGKSSSGGADLAKASSTANSALNSIKGSSSGGSDPPALPKLPDSAKALDPHFVVKVETKFEDVFTTTTKYGSKPTRRARKNRRSAHRRSF